jgi:hypothetical protein
MQSYEINELQKSSKFTLSTTLETSSHDSRGYLAYDAQIKVPKLDASVISSR